MLYPSILYVNAFSYSSILTADASTTINPRSFLFSPMEMDAGVYHIRIPFDSSHQ
jgi:hypothetical protein